MKRHSSRSEHGAALVEFAVVLPLFILLVFGIMEAGWLFSQQVEIRNATREGARLAVVDYGTMDDVIDETCDRADLSGAQTTISVQVNVADDSVTIAATKDYESLTGFIDAFSSTSLASTTEMRIERPLEDLTANDTIFFLSKDCFP